MSLQELLRTDRKWMNQAFREATRAFEKKEVPVGAIIVKEDRIIGRGHNLVEQLKDPTAHAEILAISAACQTLESKFLEGCTLYVTLEPCPMCAGALVWSRLQKVVFGAYDKKAGSCSTLYNIVQDARLNHNLEVVGGLEAEKCGALLKDFFKQRRNSI